ncbi:hypothetical protein Droror1_Dr00015785 [Drosera rotundifolia]
MIPLSFWILVSAAVAIAAYFDNKLTLSGALLAFVVSSIHFAADPRFGVLLLYFLYHAFEPTEREAADRNRIANFRGLPWGWDQVLYNSVIATVLVITGWSLTGWEYNCVYSSQSGVIKAFVGGIIGHYCCCLEHTTTPKAVRKGANGVLTWTGLWAAATAGFEIGRTYALTEYVLDKCPGESYNRLLLIALSYLICIVGSRIESLWSAPVDEDNDVHCRHVNLASISWYTLLGGLAFLVVVF